MGDRLVMEHSLVLTDQVFVLRSDIVIVQLKKWQIFEVASLPAPQLGIYYYLSKLPSYFYQELQVIIINFQMARTGIHTPTHPDWISTTTERAIFAR